MYVKRLISPLTRWTASFVTKPLPPSCIFNQYTINLTEFIECPNENIQPWCTSILHDSTLSFWLGFFSHMIKGESTKCRSITRDEKPRKLQYSETDTCFSEEEFKMKYCNICSRNKCCGPEKTSTRQVWFTCPEKKRFSKPVMFIKTCKCHKMKDCPFMWTPYWSEVELGRYWSCTDQLLSVYYNADEPILFCLTNRLDYE